jgi:hypothetical protein
MTAELTIDAAAADQAAARVTTARRAAYLNRDDDAFAATVERITVALDNTGLYERVAYADLSDAAYHALATRVQELLR